MFNLKQICDGCGKERQLSVGEAAEIQETSGGWKVVHNKKHLCATCYKIAVDMYFEWIQSHK